MDTSENLFKHKGGNTTDVMAVMIKAAASGGFLSSDIADVVSDEPATEEHIPAILFGLSRATARYLKSLEGSGVPARKLFEDMLNVWLDDVNDDRHYFEAWIQKLEDWRLGIE